MDAINQFVSPETQAAILQILTGLSLLMPVLEKLVAKTSNKIDDKIVDFVSKLLSFVPRVRGGK